MTQNKMDRAALKRIADHLRRGLLVTPADAVELAVAIEAVLQGSAASLDAALGIKRRRGDRSHLTLNKHELRDVLLRTVARQCFGDLCTSAQAETIAKGAARYESSAWLLDRAKASMPKIYAGTPREFFYRLCVMGAKVPKRRRLNDILSTAPRVQSGEPYSLHGNSSNPVPDNRRTERDADSDSQKAARSDPDRGLLGSAA